MTIADEDLVKSNKIEDTDLQIKALTIHMEMSYSTWSTPNSFWFLAKITPETKADLIFDSLNESWRHMLQMKHSCGCDSWHMARIDLAAFL